MSGTILQFVPKPRSDNAERARATVATVVQMPQAAQSKDDALAHDERGNPMSELQIALWCRLKGKGILNANQEDFVDSICVSLKRYPLSEKQQDWLLSLVSKINKALDEVTT